MKALIEAALGAVDGLAAWLTKQAKATRKDDRAAAFGLFVTAYFLYAITETFKDE